MKLHMLMGARWAKVNAMFLSKKPVEVSPSLIHQLKSFIDAFIYYWCR
jgi:hypothetical protein